MIVSVLQENLLKALTKTERNLAAKPQLPILQNVLLKTEDGLLTLTTTNLETTEIVHLGAKTEKEGALCVSCRLFAELVATLPQETVRLSVNEENLTVSCRGISATIPGVADKEFPPTPKRDKETKNFLDKEKIIEALKAVLFSAATDEGRPLLTGVKIKSEGEKLVLAATDGYRLSVKELALPNEKEVDLVVPARVLSEAVRVGTEEKDVKDVSFSQSEEGQLWFTVGDTEIVTRKIDGQYPDFKKIIPAKFTTRVCLDKEELTRAVKSAAIFARNNANIIRVHIENQNVTISANTPAVGENKIMIGAKVDGEGGDMAFNSRFLVDFLANFSGSELLFEMTGSLNPGVFRQPDDETYLHIIMPVRVSGAT